jgi:tetratricopeptide (TPR) repeat protein
LLTVSLNIKEIPHKRSILVLPVLLWGMFSLLPDITARQPLENQLPIEMKMALAKAVQDTAKISILLDSAEQIQRNNSLQALTYCFHALRLARAVPSEHHIDQALLKIGKFLVQNGVFDEGMSYYQEYYQRALVTGNVVNQLKARHNIIAVKLLIKDKYDTSLYGEMQSLLQDYEAWWKKSGDTTIVRDMMPGLLMNLSHLVLLNGQTHEADLFLQRGFELNVQYGIPQASILQLSLSDFALKAKIGKFKEAFDQASFVREICKESGNLLMLASLEYLMGNAFFEKGDTDLAIQSQRSAFSQATKLGNHSIQAQSATKLFEIYQKAGNLPEALKYNNLARQALESMKKEEAISKVAQAEMLERIHLLEKEMESEQHTRNTRLAIISSLILAMGLGGFFLFYRLRKRYSKAKVDEATYALEASKSIQEKEALTNALKVKDKLLATETIYRVQRHEIIREVVVKLHKAKRQRKADVQKELEEAIKGLERAMDSNSWEDFELKFFQVHQGFYDRLHELHPKLSTNERRLCAFLKLGMNSKEISALTGQSVKSIEMSRYRLRKKLGIQDNERAFSEIFANF